MNFESFFQTATGNKPYDWQRRLAEDSECQSRLIDIPTGLGKTAGVVNAWLWNRLSLADKGKCEKWPRRLVYCLPMRTLVEQTEAEIRDWVKKLIKAKAIAFEPRIVVLMGGENPEGRDKDWDLYPEEPAIIIGTQDMLLSRALNRGYGMSRYRWPMHFALLNNDALWVMDEVQLMGSGLETSAQLQGLRKATGLLQPCASWWMSATVSRERLKTPDFKSELSEILPLRLVSDDLAQSEVRDRAQASKSIHFSSLRLSGTKADEISAYSSALAKQIAQTHEKDSLTLVILNRVDRAQAVYKALKASTPETPLALVHSRFRPGDRADQMKILERPDGGILVATQAIEAGLDISARHLFTELAPWSALVQRMGRCNRDGKQPTGGTIHWIDLHAADDKKLRELALPYTVEALNQARAELSNLTDASPEALRSHKVAEEPAIRPILRKKDLLDLFDTTPDMAGLDLDVSRYIRDGNDTDVEVFWRKIPKNEAPDADTRQPGRAEICRVSISAFRAFVRKAKSKRIWRWQGLTEEWEEVNERSIYPGMTCLITADVGGYSSNLGWTGDPKVTLQPIEVCQHASLHDSYSGNTASQAREPETLESHTVKVVTLIETLAALLIADESLQNAVATAALWHDLGKTHYHFQKMLFGEEKVPEDGTDYLAKSATTNRCGRKFFRHELASALGWLALTKEIGASERDLVAYLIAAHHGRVRLSIRAMPHEKGPKAEPDRPFARGVWHGEQLPHNDWPAIQLNGEKLPQIILDLAPLTVGGGGETNPSWLERTLTLRNTLGPLALAYLETILRAADGRASKVEQTASLSAEDA